MSPSPSLDVRGLGATWQLVVDELRRLVPESTYATWLADLAPTRLAGVQLELVAPAEKASWIRDRFTRVLEQAASHAFARSITVVVTDGSSLPRAAWRETLQPSAHAQIRVPTNYLLHFPVERDPHARVNWRGSGVRRWAHVGATVAIDHVSTPLHLRSVVAVASCLQAGTDHDLRLVLPPEEFARAAGVRSPGGRDVLDLMRVLEDWNACKTLVVTQEVPKRARGAWGPAAPTAIVSRPPLVAAQAVMDDGEVLDPAEVRRRRLPASAIALLVLDVDETFAGLVATPDACRLVARETFGNSRRAVVTYLRYQAITPDNAGARKRYAGWPWLQQLGMHGRVDPSLEGSDDLEIARSARRTRQKCQRRSELFLHDDLQWLCRVDRDYGSVRLGDGGNGCAVVRVGIGSDPSSGERVYGPRPGAGRVPHPCRRVWRRDLVAGGKGPRVPRTFAPLPGRSRRRRISDAAAHAARRSPRPAQHTPPPPWERLAPSGPAHDG